MTEIEKLMRTASCSFLQTKRDIILANTMNYSGIFIDNSRRTYVLISITVNPPIKKSDLHVAVNNGMLIVAGDTGEKIFELGPNIATERITARLKKNVLEIHLPLVERQAIRTIPIK